MATTLGLGHRIFQISEDVPAYNIVGYDPADNSVRNNALGRPRKVIMLEDATSMPLGPIQQTDSLSGDQVKLPLRGTIAQVKISDTIQPGDPLMVDAASESTGKKGTAGSFIIGYADDYGVTGDIIDYEHDPSLFGHS